MKSNNALRTKALVSAIAVGLGGLANAAEADALQDMKAQIEALQKKVLELEQKQKETAAPDNVDDFRFTASAGNAIGRYSDGFFPDGVVGSDGRIRLPKQRGWFAAYRHYWFDQLRSNLVLSTAGENNPAGAPANTDKSTRSAHVNLIWSPVANSDPGLEYIHADRETEDGLKRHLSRLQASAKYAF